MSTRGQYGKLGGRGRTHVGAQLVHTLELKQRYSNVKTAAVQALLRDLSNDGVASTVGTNRYEIALKDGAWVIFAWYPDYDALEVTITDRELRPVDQVAPARRRYEAILRKITPVLQTYGATTVGGAVVGAAARTEGAFANGGRSSMSGRHNTRGEYGDRRRSVRGVYVGAFETPDEIAAGLDQTHAIFSQYGEEVHRDTFPARARENSRILNDPDYKLLRERVRTVEDLASKAPPGSQVRAIHEKVARDLANKRDEDYKRRLSATQDPGLKWYLTVWEPFYSDWTGFYSDKAVLKALPGRGVWNQVQEFRDRFITLRDRSPVSVRAPELPPSPPPESNGPPPVTESAPQDRALPPTGPKAPSAGPSVGTIATYAAIGALVVGSAIVIAKLR